MFMFSVSFGVPCAVLFRPIVNYLTTA